MKRFKRHRRRIAELRRRLKVWQAATVVPDPPPGVVPGSFFIARILGNDLYPRHGRGTMLANLKFVLENETFPARARRFFILNRLIDAVDEAEAIRMIEAAGDDYAVIPFHAEEFFAAGWNAESFGGAAFFDRAISYQTEKWRQDLMRIWAAAPKVAYVMNVNGARNLALAKGRAAAEWTVVVDGSCVFTEASFKAFADTCAAVPFSPYVVLPMERIGDNAVFSTRQPRVDAGEEPQVAFHWSTKLRFDERFVYGLRDKTSLLRSLGVAGPWDDWDPICWLPQEELRHPDRFFFKRSKGGVFRLSSGGGGLEDRSAQKARHRIRNRAIIGTISHLCKEYGTRDANLAQKILGTSHLDKG